MITGPQIFEARRLLRWSSDKLAVEAGVGIGVMHAVEQSPSKLAIAADQVQAILTALDRAGIMVLPGIEGEAAVRWRMRTDPIRQPA